jgi:hypothetical protein
MPKRQNGYPEEFVPLKGEEEGELIPLKKSSRGNSYNTRRQRRRQLWLSCAMLTISVLALLLSGWALYRFLFCGVDSSSNVSNTGDTAPVFYYDESGRFVLEDYDVHPPFSNFLPALAGYYGKPLYAFYVNRGQGIASFGTESKEYPIMEFQPANKAYQMTPAIGFRTFLQLEEIVEPFSPRTTRHEGLPREDLPKRIMYVGASNEMLIQEVDEKHGLETNVTFFILPEEYV